MKIIGTVLLVIGVFGIIGGVGAGLRGADISGAGGALLLVILGWYLRNRAKKSSQNK